MTWIRWGKSLLVAFILSGIFLVILAAGMYFLDWQEKMVRGSVLVIYVLACFVGGMLLSKGATKRRYFFGMLFGLAYYLVIFVGGMIAGGGALRAGQIVTPMVMCALSGMIGGMIQAGK